MSEEGRVKRNRLANEKSPYLLQHASNPVDWFPWGDEAFNKARQEDKPIFLSIGYATCHWCHVMARECFEDPSVARILNQFFISIKVDREERPDVDLIYMRACQALTGTGGWPLSVFLTPKGEPFFAGTYFPKVSKMGLPGFGDLLLQIANLWKTSRNRVLDAARQLSQVLIQGTLETEDQFIDDRLLRAGYEALARSFDTKYGGFGSAPKFPTPHQLWFLMRWYARAKEPLALEMVEKTLLEMRRGGIFDQLGYGFHRYSVDERWCVPHFEKMLYDQALLLLAYCEAFQLTKKEIYEKTAHEIVTYVKRELMNQEGAFICGEDADTNGQEGAFYTWSKRDVEEVLGKDVADVICTYLGISERGYLEAGSNVLRIASDPKYVASRYGLSWEEFQLLWENARDALFRARQKRPRPLKDDKVLTSWNGLMIASLSRAAWVLGRDDYALLAKNAANFVLQNLYSEKGRLMRRWRDGEAAYHGTLEDYSALAWSFWELYQLTLDAQWLEKATILADLMVNLFWDTKGGGFFFTAVDHDGLVTRTKDYADGAIPSGNSMVVMVLSRLGRALGRMDLEEKAWATARSCPRLVDVPHAYTYMLCAVDFMLGPSHEVLIVGNSEHDSTRNMISVLREGFRPRMVVVMKEEGQRGRLLEQIAPKVRSIPVNAFQCTAQICCGKTCIGSVSHPDELKSALIQLEKLG